jgi:uncharacterized protein
VPRIGDRIGAWAMVTATVFDSLEFARSQQELQGTLDVAQLARVTDSLFDSAGSLAYQLAGGYDSRQRPIIKLKVDGELNLKCQRCLGKLPFRVASESSLLVLLSSSPAGGDVIEDLDGIPASHDADALALVEDEVLLAVPFAPRHPDGQCNTAAEVAKETPVSPFAMLARLRQDTTQN